MTKFTRFVVAVFFLVNTYIFFTRPFEESLAWSSSALFIACALGVLLIIVWFVKELIKGLMDTIKLIGRGREK